MTPSAGGLSPDGRRTPPPGTPPGIETTPDGDARRAPGSRRTSPPGGAHPADVATPAAVRIAADGSTVLSATVRPEAAR
ncbi:hypothetical protein GCM10010517_39260 [Streptosporangium fragile]|uniref:Uncharacterized protein n=1 Tax=Streptosporangium fragile TaxID=46186 RepID=A0ABN3W067_9ACTN